MLKTLVKCEFSQWKNRTLIKIQEQTHTHTEWNSKMEYIEKHLIKLRSKHDF